MFACSECVGANQTGPMLMKLTTICDVSHVISYTRPSSPLFFSGGRPGNEASLQLLGPLVTVTARQAGS